MSSFYMACPLLMEAVFYLFILFLEPFLRWLQRGQNGYTFCTSNSHESAAAYADDLAAITNNIKAL
jgi:hypothetical protein